MWLNIFSNLVWFVLFVGLSGVWLLIRRRSLLGLFRVSRKNGLIVYLSRINVVEGGSTDLAGRARRYQGPTVTVGECASATVLIRLFEYLIPGITSLPSPLKTLFTRDISVQIEPAPRSPSEIPDGCTVVTVGSPGYNNISAWAQSKLNPKVWFNQNNDAFVTKSGRNVSDPALGMVQVLFDAQTGRRVFFVAGLSEAGTCAALDFLGTRWKELKRHLADGDAYCGFVQMQNGKPRLVETIH
jgi:hypothetical protein